MLHVRAELTLAGKDHQRVQLRHRLHSRAQGEDGAAQFVRR